MRTLVLELLFLSNLLSIKCDAQCGDFPCHDLWPYNRVIPPFFPYFYGAYFNLDIMDKKSINYTGNHAGMEIKRHTGKYNDNQLRDSIWTSYGLIGNEWQKWEECFFVNGRREGIATRWVFGKKMLEGRYKNDKRDSIWTQWWDGNQKQYKGRYVNGEKDGLWTSWHENGQKEYQVLYKNGKIEGDSALIAWYKTGFKREEVQLKNGLKNGQYISWYDFPINFKQWVGNFNNDKPEGTWTEYHSNGTIRTSMFFKDGQLNGPYTVYHGNGEISISMAFKENQLIGNYVSYYDNKNKKTEANFLNGKADGVICQWNSNGTIKSIGRFESGKKQGTHKLYYHSYLFPVKKIYQDDTLRRTIDHNNMGPIIGLKYNGAPFIEIGWAIVALHPDERHGNWDLSVPLPHYKGLNISSDFNYNNKKFIIGPKISYNAMLTLLDFRMSVTNYTDFKQNDMRLTPELGLTWIGFFTISYGYNLPISKYIFNEINRNQITLKCVFLPAIL